MDATIADAAVSPLPLKKLCARRMAKAHRSIERRSDLVSLAHAAAGQIAQQLSATLGAKAELEAKLLPTAVEASRTVSWAGGFAVFDLTASGERAALELELPFLVSLLERLAGRSGAATPVLELTRAEEAAFGFLALVALDAGSKSPIFQLFSPRLQSVQTERGAVLAELSREAHLVVELRITVGDRSGLARLVVPARAVEAALNAVPESPVVGTLPAIRLDATCRMGRTHLEQDALEGLASGDVVVFEAIASREGKLVGPAALHTKSFSLHGEFANEGFTLARSLTRRTLEIPMSTPANLPVEVEIELGRIQLPIADLATLRDGSVLALHLDARQPVILRVGDRAIARAELVELDGEIGARILNLL